MADCKRKTGNLYSGTDISGSINNTYYKDDFVYANLSQGIYTLAFDLKTTATVTYTSSIGVGTTEYSKDIQYQFFKTDGHFVFTFTIEAEDAGKNLYARFARFNTAVTITYTASNIMLNTGSTALPYEPYGWVHSLRKLGTATETIQSGDTIYADGTAATVSLKGNATQSGTPTPSNPIQPSECGERTENLFDGQLQQGYYAYSTGEYTLADTYVCTHLIPCTENTTYTFRCINTGGSSKNYGYVFLDSAQNRIDSDYSIEPTEGDVVTHTATTPQNTAFLAINIAYGRRQAGVIRPSDITDFMLNTGSTPLPYEPYGYKIPILSTNTTTPVYLGEVQTTRRVKKLVLTGEEAIEVKLGNAQWYIPIADMKTPTNVSVAEWYCSHYQAVANNATWTSYDYMISWSALDTGSSVGLRIRDIDFLTGVTLADFKAYLAAQYAVGTPVTVWYVLAEPTTGIVNEPLMKIGDYADGVSNVSIPVTVGRDTISVGTTVQPSEITVNYKGWHPVADVHERESGQWD